MSIRLQVLLDEAEMREIKAASVQARMTVAEWVLRALREARSELSTVPPERKLLVVREATRHGYPTGDIERMNEEILRGYGGGGE